MIALFHARPLTTSTTTPKLIMAIMAHMARHIAFHMEFPIE
jgi:hypothetical protein